MKLLDDSEASKQHLKPVIQLVIHMFLYHVNINMPHYSFIYSSVHRCYESTASCWYLWFTLVITLQLWFHRSGKSARQRTTISAIGSVLSITRVPWIVKRPCFHNNHSVLNVFPCGNNTVFFGLICEQIIKERDFSFTKPREPLLWNKNEVTFQ